MTSKAELTDQEILDRLASWVVAKRMTAPAILFLESHRPLSFVGSQAMIAASPIVHFFEPFLQSLMGPGYEHRVFKRFAVLMEKRESVESLIVAVERLSQVANEKVREEKAHRKALKREAKEKRKALRRSRRGEVHGDPGETHE
jgi:hypothetical protein